MPQHGSYRTPVLEFIAWLWSGLCRPVVPLVDLAEWFGLELLDVTVRRAQWFRARMRTRWRWQAGVALVVLGCAVVTVVSLR